MSFQYGSNVPDIKNPFKPEGLLYITSGVLILALGVYALLTLRSLIPENDLASGWVKLSVCMLLLGWGIAHISAGLLRVFRFYIGRGVPTSLSRNMARSEKHVHEANVVYTSEDLDQMIMGRKNTTFQEPVTLQDRLVYSIFPKLLFLPYSMRNYLHVMVHNFSYTLVAIFVYLLSILSGSVGLTMLADSSYSQWLGILLCGFLFIVWLRNPLSVNRVTRKELYLGKKSNLAWLTAFAVLVPAGAEYMIRQGVEIPAVPFHPGLPLVVLLALIAMIMPIGFTLAKFRSELVAPLTEVSEFREHWQENVHPKEFFRGLDMELANLRYMEFPNRVYRELTPNLQMEGSADKGNFSGDTILETQPVFHHEEFPLAFKKLRLSVAVCGHVLLLLSALTLYALNVNHGSPVSVSAIFNGIYYPAILWIFGKALLTLAHLYWGEILYKSFIIQFLGEGTYTESKISAGMSITDSVRSENAVVRTSFSPWLHVTEILSSTQARSGSGNLSGPRYLLSMRKENEMLEHLVKQLRDFLDNKESIANSMTKKDMASIETLFTLNEAAPAKEWMPGSNSQAPAKKLLFSSDIKSDES